MEHDDTQAAPGGGATPYQPWGKNAANGDLAPGAAVGPVSGTPGGEGQPWSAQQSDAPTQMGTPSLPPTPRMSEPPMPWAAQRQSAPPPLHAQQYGSQDRPYTPAPPPKRRSGMGWIVPVVIGLAAIAAFAVAWFFMNGKDESPSANPSVAKSPSAMSSASPSTSIYVAPFPANSSPTCGTGGSSDPLNVERAQLLNGSNTSCQYARDVIGEVKSWVDKHPDATNFQVSAISQARHGQRISLTCTRSDHLSECQGGTSVHLWVQDTVG